MNATREKSATDLIDEAAARVFDVARRLTISGAIEEIDDLDIVLGELSEARTMLAGAPEWARIHPRHHEFSSSRAEPV